MTGTDALSLANELDETWHGQSRAFEREAVMRFWGLLTLPARVLDPARPRQLLAKATVLRNARFKGAPVQTMFFSDKDFTEVDAVFLQVGSSLGHPNGEDAWIIEVERKTGNHQGDYYLAVQRAKKFADLFRRQFGVRARPVVIYEDDGGKYSYQAFDGDTLLIQMGTLRARTQGLTFPSLFDLPGVASDKTLVKLALMRQLVANDPNHPDGYAGPLALARDVEDQGLPLRLPVVGHQDTATWPDSLSKWLKVELESDAHLAERIDRYLNELHTVGVLSHRHPNPRLSLSGGQAVLRLLHAASQEPT